jgi:hypothetical protein
MFSWRFPIWNSYPNLENYRRAIKDEIDSRYNYYFPFIVGLANFNQRQIKNFTFFELDVLREIESMRIEYTNNKYTNVRQIKLSSDKD